MSLAFVAILAQMATSAGAADFLDRRVSNVTVYSGREIEVCGKIDVPCGWEAAEHDEAVASTSAIVRKFTGTVRDALDEVVRGTSGYTWRLDSGVINFVPKSGEGMTKDGKPILDIVIEDFKIEGLTTDAAARRACEAAGLPCGAVGSAGGRRRHPRINLHLKNVTLRQALNGIVQKDGNAAWRFQFNKYGKNYVVMTWDWGKGKGSTLFK